MVFEEIMIRQHKQASAFFNVSSIFDVVGVQSLLFFILTFWKVIFTSKRTSLALLKKSPYPLFFVDIWLVDNNRLSAPNPLFFMYTWAEKTGEEIAENWLS